MEQPQPVDMGDKPKNTVLKPLAAQVIRAQDGTTIVVLDIGPFESATILLPEEARKALVGALTGGIVPASPGEILQ